MLDPGRPVPLAKVKGVFRDILACEADTELFYRVPHGHFSALKSE